jgi:tetratricopeptide (TPR) repeat protein
MGETRLDGWKSISTYLRRDRSTVMRWYRERGLPVRRVPGGKQGSVYALTSEIEQWILSAGSVVASEPADLPETEPGQGPDEVAPVPRSNRHMLAYGLGGACVLAAAGFGGWSLMYRAVPPQAVVADQLPSSPVMARLYLNAREKWAGRTEQSLTEAIRDFETLTRREPSFAPGFVGLAECYLLAREFGSVSDAVAFERAEAASRAALARNSGLYSAHRATGFIAYWWRADPRAAGAAFRQALALAPHEPQTLYWYANVLADNGQAEESLRMYAQAMAISPGRIEVALDQAWAEWSAGHDDMADRQLRALEQAAADNPVYHNIIGDIRMIRGDWAGYIDALERHGALRQEPGLMREAADLRSAEPAGDAAIAALTLAQALSGAESSARRSYSWSAMIASTMGDRGQLIKILRKAVARRETWRTAGYQRRIADRWQDDSEVLDLLADVRQPSVMEPPKS